MAIIGNAALDNSIASQDNIMKITPHIPLALTAALLLGACSSSGPSTLDTGQRISQRGGEIGNFGSAWSEGREDVRQGRRLVERSSGVAEDAEKKLARAQADVRKAQERIRKAQADRTDGEQLIAGGTDRMERAEADYVRARTGPSAITGD